MVEVLDIPGDGFATAQPAQWWSRYDPAGVERFAFHDNLAVEENVVLGKEAG